MAATKYAHKTADGVVHTRNSKAGRMYTHVIVNTLSAACLENGTAAPICHVWAWVGRPDLVAGALREHTRANTNPERITAEAINGGVRRRESDEVDGAYVATSSGEGAAE